VDQNRSKSITSVVMGHDRKSYKSKEERKKKTRPLRRGPKKRNPKFRVAGERGKIRKQGKKREVRKSPPPLSRPKQRTVGAQSSESTQSFGKKNHRNEGGEKGKPRRKGGGTPLVWEKEKRRLPAREKKERKANQKKEKDDCR